MQHPCNPWSGIFVNNDDPVYMVRHNHECIQTDKRKMNWYFIPHLKCNYTDFRQLHFTVDYFSKPFSLKCSTNCNKIFPRKGIIPSGIS